MKTEYDYKFVKNKYLPIIDVLLKSEKNILLTEAYIDSGATISAFNYKVAKVLGIDYKKGKEVISKGITERTKAFKNKIKIIFQNNELELETIFIESDEMQFNLLGLKDFFDAFRITFDNKNKKVLLEN